jgi:hypothetical protein
MPYPKSRALRYHQPPKEPPKLSASATQARLEKTFLCGHRLSASAFQSEQKPIQPGNPGLNIKIVPTLVVDPDNPCPDCIRIIQHSAGETAALLVLGEDVVRRVGPEKMAKLLGKDYKDPKLLLQQHRQAQAEILAKPQLQSREFSQTEEAVEQENLNKVLGDFYKREARHDALNAAKTRIINGRYVCRAEMEKLANSQAELYQVDLQHDREMAEKYEIPWEGPPLTMEEAMDIGPPALGIEFSDRDTEQGIESASMSRWANEYCSRFQPATSNVNKLNIVPSSALLRLQQDTIKKDGPAVAEEDSKRSRLPESVTRDHDSPNSRKLLFQTPAGLLEVDIGDRFGLARMLPSTDS